MTDFLYNGPVDAPATLLLAHGAGAGMESGSMTLFAEALGGAGLRVARFEFAYMAVRRDGSGKRPPPSPANKLIAEYSGAIASVEKSGKLVIGGKSMGGRMASMIAQTQYEAGTIAGLLCLGYPFHPPGNPEKLRTDHLAPLTVPTLICQGERDPFGTRDAVVGYSLPASIEMMWLVDGDHDLKPRRASGFSHKEHVDSVVKRVCDWIANL